MFWPSIGNNFLHNLGQEDTFLCVSVFGFYLSTYSFIFGCAGSFFCCMLAFSSCGEQKLLYSYAAQAPPVAEHQL